MTPSAWITLILTWTVVGFFAGRFFLKVLRTPLAPPEDGERGG